VHQRRTSRKATNVPQIADLTEAGPEAKLLLFLETDHLATRCAERVNDPQIELDQTGRMTRHRDQGRASFSLGSQAFGTANDRVDGAVGIEGVDAIQVLEIWRARMLS
jgi:hypothetical protein